MSNIPTTYPDLCSPKQNYLKANIENNYPPEAEVVFVEQYNSRNTLKEVNKTKSDTVSKTFIDIINERMNKYKEKNGIEMSYSNLRDMYG